MKITFTIITVFLLLSCGSDNTKTNQFGKDTKIDRIEDIESAHKKSDFLKKDALQFDIVLSFGGSERLNGKMTLTTNSVQGKIETASGDTLMWNNEAVYHNVGYSKPKGARFAAYTWSYFSLFPYKLSDAGTQWSEFGQEKLLGKDLDSQKLTFDAGTGDAPDDWYIAYSDPKSALIEVAAYIVTAGGTVAEAEEDPHAIKYSNYQMISGIPIATEWTFWEWRSGQDMTKQLGEASISNVRFLSTEENTFFVPRTFLKK